MTNRRPARDRLGALGWRRGSQYRGSRVTLVEGRDLSSRQTQYVVKDLEIGQPINSDECSETADGVARESEGVKSCPRAGCGKSACPVVCPVKAGVFSRRQPCRGKSQAPRSLDGRVEGNQDSEAHRQGLPRGDHESPGRNESERESGLENE